MRRTTTNPRPFSPFFDQKSMKQGEGGQTDWSRVSSSFYDVAKFTVKLNGAAAKGAASITVDPLLHPVKKGAYLNFGTVPDVVVTTSGAAQAATSVPVTALTGAIPSGTVLDFGGSKQVKLSANAAQGATALTVVALDTALVNADTATYQGGSLDAEVKADAAKGATTISVVKLQYAIADNAEAETNFPSDNQDRLIPQGTFACRTATGLLIPRREYSATLNDVKTNEFYASDVIENAVSAAKSGHGTVRDGGLYENLLPDSDTNGDFPYKSELANTNFFFVEYEDSRLT